MIDAFDIKPVGQSRFSGFSDGGERRMVDVDSPDAVGPPELHARLRHHPIPTRDDLAKALIAHFTGHLPISTTMRGQQLAPRPD